MVLFIALHRCQSDPALVYLTDLGQPHLMQQEHRQIPGWGILRRDSQPMAPGTIKSCHSKNNSECKTCSARAQRWPSPWILLSWSSFYIFPPVIEREGTEGSTSEAENPSPCSLEQIWGERQHTKGRVLDAPSKRHALPTGSISCQGSLKRQMLFFL